MHGLIGALAALSAVLTVLAVIGGLAWAIAQDRWHICEFIICAFFAAMIAVIIWAGWTGALWR